MGLWGSLASVLPSGRQPKLRWGRRGHQARQVPPGPLYVGNHSSFWCSTDAHEQKLPPFLSEVAGSESRQWPGQEAGCGPRQGLAFLSIRAAPRAGGRPSLEPSAWHQLAERTGPAGSGSRALRVAREPTCWLCSGGGGVRWELHQFRVQRPSLSGPGRRWPPDLELVTQPF